MKVQKTGLVCFSPTGSTKHVLEVFAKAFGVKMEQFDLTDFDQQGRILAFPPDELMVIGVPVYSGRVPKTALERFESLKGEGGPAVLIAAYGNRDYDDALLELKDLAETKGFCPIAAAAVVTEHSIARKIGAGRPNTQDLAALAEFAERVREKLDRGEEGDLQVKGNPVYREYKSVPIRPHGTARCNGCGICVRRCPVGAIPADHPRRTEKERCIGCLRCVKLCPQHARIVPKLLLAGAEKMIASKCSGDKQPEFFL